jgi:hypothetical protein
MENRLSDQANEEVLARHQQALRDWEEETEKTAPLLTGRQ